MHVKEILHLTARGACLAKDVYKCNAIKKSISEIMKSAEEELSKSEISDQTKYLLDQKIEVLKSIN